MSNIKGQHARHPPSQAGADGRSHRHRRSAADSRVSQGAHAGTGGAGAAPGARQRGAGAPDHRQARSGDRDADRPGARRVCRPAVRQDQPARAGSGSGHRRAVGSVRPQARDRGDRQDRRDADRRRARSLRAVSRRGHQAGDRAARDRARRRDANRRRGAEQGLLRAEHQPEDRRATALGHVASSPRAREPGVSVVRRRRARSSRGARS